MSTGITSKRSSLQLLATYLTPHRSRVIVLGVVMLAAIGLQIASPIVMARFIDGITSDATLRQLVWLAVATIVIALIGQVISLIETWLAESISWDATNALRLDIVAHMLRLDSGYFLSKSIGELIERADSDVGNLSRFFSRFALNLIGNGIFILVVIGMLFAIDWRIGLALLLVVALTLGLLQLIRKKAEPLWERERDATSTYYGFVSEVIAGAGDIRSSAAIPHVMTKHAQTMRSWLAATRKAGMMGYAMIATSSELFSLGLAACLGIGAMLFLRDAISLGTLFLIYRLTSLLRQPIEQLRNEIQDFQLAAASIDRITTLLGTESHLRDLGQTPLPEGPLSIELAGVSFAYDGGRPVLSDVSLNVPAGRVLGIVGHTGGGKTTLTRLVSRFFDPTEGTMRIGGIDARNIPLAELRSRVGIVSQNVDLFHATLRDNLTLFDDTVSDDRITGILREVGLKEWFTLLPNGLDSFISPESAGLSAGQAQLIICARLLLTSPDIVILDEASARLDPPTERTLHAAFARLIQGRTAIIVAHRLSTISFADDVAVIEHGELVEHGPRETLAADPSSRYAALLLASEEAFAA